MKMKQNLVEILEAKGGRGDVTHSARPYDHHIYSRSPLVNVD